jgi:hypothetical protein
MADVDFELRPDNPSSPTRKVWDAESLETSPSGSYALVFALAGQHFAIAADYIEQIVELPAIVNVPASDASLLGLTARAGQPVPVVDIAPLLGLQSPGVHGLRHGLLLNHQSLKAMLAIESVVVLKELPGMTDDELPIEYQSCGFVAYACGVPPGDTFSASAHGDTPENSGSGDAPEDSVTGMQVLVLEVPQLLSAVQLAAGQGPAS